MDLVTVLRNLPNRQDREDVLREIQEDRRHMAYGYELRVALAREGLVKSVAQYYEERLAEYGPGETEDDDKKRDAAYNELDELADYHIHVFEDGSCLSMQDFRAGELTLVE